ncbi:hypothetical protein [Rheinheimera sediminis]|uniref:hypothetical protein n=1 Tax=Rheinheimera sp. YQF-1 TaxID=2499626 RepID=UPI0011AEB94F|nr:hypothetical protein [Rheinheimera sp. YQF-1]
MENEFTIGQYAFLISFSIFLDLLPTIGYFLGSFFCKSQKLHWSTQLFLGVISGLFTQVLLPKLGLVGGEGEPMGFISGILFIIAFAQPQIQFWRVKPTT